jgi:outer membrane cobalamin receptor
VLDVDPTYGAFGGKLTAPGYASTDLGGSVRVWRDVWLFGRVTNVFDRAYEETFGFPSPGRRAFGGLRVAARR